MAEARQYSSSSAAAAEEPYRGATVNPPEHDVKVLEGGVRQLTKLLTRDPDRFLRLTVNSGGCSGYQYEFRMEPLNTLNEKGDDFVFKFEPASSSSGGDASKTTAPILVVDAMSLDFLDGCEVDYTTEMIRSSFQVVKNKSAENSCGCGASFSVGSGF